MRGPAHWRALDFIGAGEKSRTPDLRITNALLYQLSYAGVGETTILADPRRFARITDQGFDRQASESQPSRVRISLPAPARQTARDRAL